MPSFQPGTLVSRMGLDPQASHLFLVTSESLSRIPVRFRLGGDQRLSAYYCMPLLSHLMLTFGKKPLTVHLVTRLSMGDGGRGTGYINFTVWNVDSVVLHASFSAFSFLSSVDFYLTFSYIFLPVGQFGQVICVFPRLCLAVNLSLILR